MASENEFVEVDHPGGQITEVRRRTATPQVRSLERGAGGVPHQAQEQGCGQERRAKLMVSCTVVEDHTGPVYVDDGDHWYPTPFDAFDALWDQEVDPNGPDALIHPCDVGKAGTPNLIEEVEEAWGSEYDDPDIVDTEVSKPLASILEGVQYLLEKAAPDVWRPRLKERIQLPPAPEPVHHMDDVPDGTRWYPGDPNGT